MLRDLRETDVKAICDINQEALGYSFSQEETASQLTRLSQDQHHFLLGYEDEGGSKHLLLLADKIDEIKTICQYCKKKATMVLRTQNGLPVYDGEQIQIGGNETYISVCRKHYFAPLITSKKEQDYDN